VVLPDVPRLRELPRRVLTELGEGDVAEINHAVVTGRDALGQDATAVEHAIELRAGGDYARISNRRGEAWVYRVGGAGQAEGQAERRNVGACCEQLLHCLLLWLMYCGQTTAL